MTLLNTTMPLTLIARAISPQHLAVPFSLVIYVTARVHISALPSEYSVSVLLVIGVFALIGVGWCGLRFPPLPMAVLHALAEVPRIHTPVLPHVLTLPVRLPVLVMACVCVSIRK